MSEGIVYGTGIKQEAVGKLSAALPPFTGRHLCVFTAMWRVQNPARAQHNFDMENLITVEGPGCFWCEQMWTPTLGAKCTGDPAGWKPKEAPDA